MRARARALKGFAASLALVATACTSDERAESLPTTVSAPSTDPAPTSPPVESIAPETLASTSTVARQTTTTTATTTTTLPATTTSIAVAAPDLTLRPNGLGGFDFGDHPDAVLAASNEAFGNPSSDETTEYSIFDGSWHVNEQDITQLFVHPVGRDVCWTDLCLHIGGTHDVVSLVGWTYRDGERDGISSPAVSNRDGVTIGSRWSDFLDALAIPPGGCYELGYGATADGIGVVVVGDSFSTNLDDGTYVPLLPDPHEVTVRELHAGDRPWSLESDC